MGNQTEIRHHIGSTGTFVLRTLSGSVHLTGADGDEAVVIARSSHGELPELIVDRGPGRLLVEPPRVGLSIVRRHDVDIEFEVTLPRGARIDLKSVSGDISGHGLAGEQDYRTVSGDLRLSGVAGRLSVQTISGDIRVEDGKRLELNAVTTSGDVQLVGELIDYLRVRTVSGDIRAAGRLSDGPRHAVETVSGDLEFRSTGGVTVEPARALDIGRNSRRPIVIGDGSAQLSFRSMSGEERISGPAGEGRPARPAIHQPRLDVLRALERGEIDVEEAARRLEEVSVDA